MRSEGDTDRQTRIAWLTLKLIPDLGNRSILKLVRHFGTPMAVLSAPERAVEQVPGLRCRARFALRENNRPHGTAEEWENLHRQGIRLISFLDADYPANLKEIADPPAVLFCLGALEPRDLVAVAVVGSRAASPMGMHFTERLCGDLAAAGVTVVSGFAVGIDGAAHRGALKAGGRTLAVLGCGIDIDYPRPHAGLRGDVIGHGALLSEFPMGTPPAPAHFPQRNRIISGLSLGVVVVEAAHRSGSLITARFALEQGREVFAVPGMARHFRSVGPHGLLKQGAKLVEGAEDILEEIRPLLGTGLSRRESGKPEYSENPAGGDLPREEGRIVSALSAMPIHIDEIARVTEMSASSLSALLLGLELRGVVRQLPGKYFVLD